MKTTFLPEHPNHLWRRSALKYACSINPELLLESTPQDLEIEYIDIAALDGGSVATAPKMIRFGEAPSRARRVLRTGDTIVSTVRTYLRAVSNFPLVDSHLIASTGFAVARPNGVLHPRYAYWLILSEPFIESVVAHSDGVSYPAINPSVLGRLDVVIPPRAAQAQIANFLDERTARIDALIAEKERLLELIDEFVDSTRDYELSGGGNASKATAYWIYPQIPEHWNVVPFKSAVDFVEGPGIMASDFCDDGIPLLRVSSVRGSFASLEGCNYLDPKKVEKTWSHFRVKKGDLLISASASMGTVSEVDSLTEGAVPYTGIIILRPKAGLVSAEFVRQFVVSGQFSRQIDLMKTGTTIQHFGPTHLSRVLMAMPASLSGQSEVTQRLQASQSSLSSLSAHSTKHIDCLREYRSSLISAAVTGQIDINSFQSSEAA